MNFINIIQKAIFFQVGEQLNIMRKRTDIYISVQGFDSDIVDRFSSNDASPVWAPLFYYVPPYFHIFNPWSDLTLEGRPYSATPFLKKDYTVDALLLFAQAR